VANSETLEDLLDYINQDGKVCPMPREWDQMWRMLPGKTDPPLILAAWHTTGDLEKRNRFLGHLFYAEDHNVIKPVSEFLGSLRPNQWLNGLRTLTR
jgi:hypothetical protein